MLFTTSQTNPFKNSSGSAHRLTSRTTGSKPFNRPKRGDSHKPATPTTQHQIFANRKNTRHLHSSENPHPHTRHQLTKNGATDIFLSFSKHPRQHGLAAVIPAPGPQPVEVYASVLGQQVSECSKVESRVSGRGRTGL